MTSGACEHLGKFKKTKQNKTPFYLCLHGCFIHGGSVADHPENGSGRLLHLMGATPSALHRSQTKVPDFHGQTFMQEDVFASVKELATVLTDRHTQTPPLFFSGGVCGGATAAWKGYCWTSCHDE